MTVYASIITYNPKKELLGKAVSAVIDQIDKLIIVDNFSNNGFSFAQKMVFFIKLNQFECCTTAIA